MAVNPVYLLSALQKNLANLICDCYSLLMAPLRQISTLVDRFGHNREACLSGDYNEAQLRREFVDPFFCRVGMGR
jgi:hypothetical protein